MRPRVVLIGVTFLVTIVAAVLWLHGTDEEGLRAAIRTTARTSALCVGLAFARIRVRELSVLLPVSHAMHYVLILNTDRVTVQSIQEKLTRCRQTLEEIKPGCTSPKSRKRKMRPV